jgi:phage shock protein E
MGATKTGAITMSISQFSMEDLFKIYSSLKPNELILDVRTAEEFAEGHVPGAKNIPHTAVAEHAGELKKFEKIYVHCQAGKRAQVASQALQKAGITNLVVIQNSGMGNWIASGHPIQK